MLVLSQLWAFYSLFFLTGCLLVLISKFWCFRFFLMALGLLFGWWAIVLSYFCLMCLNALFFLCFRVSFLDGFQVFYFWLILVGFGWRNTDLNFLLFSLNSYDLVQWISWSIWSNFAESSHSRCSLLLNDSLPKKFPLLLLNSHLILCLWEKHRSYWYLIS